MLLHKKLWVVIFCISVASFAQAQIADTAVARKIYLSKDTVRLPASTNLLLKEPAADSKARSPRKAAIRSAILPGWGQVYNRKLWKVPIVYLALGAAAYYFFDNRQVYKQLQLGVQVANNISSTGDSTGYDKITYPSIKYDVDRNNQNSLKYYRDQYRRDVDFAAFYFLLAWGLNVVEATVDAHLSGFDINENLTFKIQPGYSELGKTNGLSLVLKFK